MSSTNAAASQMLSQMSDAVAAPSVLQLIEVSPEGACDTGIFFIPVDKLPLSIIMVLDRQEDPHVINVENDKWTKLTEGMLFDDGTDAQVETAKECEDFFGNAGRNPEWLTSRGALLEKPVKIEFIVKVFG